MLMDAHVTPKQQTRAGGGGADASAHSSATPTGRTHAPPSPRLHQQQHHHHHPHTRAMTMAPPSTVPSVPTTSAASARAPPVAAAAAWHPSTTARPTRDAATAATATARADRPSPTANVNVSLSRDTPSSSPHTAAAALAPVMGHRYGSSGHPASVESTPYSYLSRVTPILARDERHSPQSGLDSDSKHNSVTQSNRHPSFAVSPADRHPARPPERGRDAGINNSRTDAADDANDANDNPESEAVRAADTAAIVAMNVARQTYNEKLRGSLEGVMEALASELPQDHIFLQLMADPATAQYGKVRLGEIVEGFLYATQAQQYHNLAAELAQREIDNVALGARVAELERRLQLETSRSDGGNGGAGGQPHSATAADDGGGRNGANATTDATNPMSEEEARRELMAILEATSREHELDRCRRALAAPAKLAEIAQTEPNYTEKYEYVADVVGELYRAVHAFMRYADGSLESLETLRNDLAVADADWRINEHPSDFTKGGAVSSHNKNNQQQQQQRLLVSHPPSLPERHRIHELSEQLRDAQVLTARALDRLQHKARAQDQEIAQLSRDLAAARAKDSTKTAAAHSEARAMQQELNDMIREHERAMTAQREEAQRQFQELQSRLRRVEGERNDAQRDAAAATAQVEVLEQELRLAQRTGSQQESEATEAVTALRNELHLRQADLRACEAELLCAQVEVCMSTLEALYHESTSAKNELLQRSGGGWEGVARALAQRTRTAQEDLRHTKAQLENAEAAALERQVAVRAAMEELAALLRAVWEEESVAAALQLVAEGASRHDGPSPISLASSATATDGAGHVDAADAPSLQALHGGGAHDAAGLKASGAPDNSAGAAPWKQVQDAHKLPTTLPGLTTALAYAFRDLKGRTHSWYRALERTRAGLAERDRRIRALEAAEAQLQSQLQAESDQARQLRAELDAVADASPMRELLAKQDALLKAVNLERNALQRQWSALNADYITLERRNGQLHERCAAKEHENAKLSGLLRVGGGGVGSTSESRVSAADASHSPLSLDMQTPRQPRWWQARTGGSGRHIRGESSSSSTAQSEEKEGARHATDEVPSRWFPESIGTNPTSGSRGGRVLARTPVTIDRHAGRGEGVGGEESPDDFDAL